MPDFTSGPWHTDAQPTLWPDKKVTDLMVRTEEGEPVAWVGMAATHQDTAAYRNIEANAALIAEAPHLVKMLYVIHEAMRRSEWNADTADWIGDYLYRVVAPALARVGVIPEEPDWSQGHPMEISQIDTQIFREAAWFYHPHTDK